MFHILPQICTAQAHASCSLKQMQYRFAVIFGPPVFTRAERLDPMGIPIFIPIYKIRATSRFVPIRGFQKLRFNKDPWENLLSES